MHQRGLILAGGHQVPQSNPKHNVMAVQRDPVTTTLPYLVLSHLRVVAAPDTFLRRFMPALHVKQGLSHRCLVAGCDLPHLVHVHGVVAMSSVWATRCDSIVCTEHRGKKPVYHTLSRVAVFAIIVHDLLMVGLG